MSEETIPLTFTAEDNLSKAVQNMTTTLEKMGVVQDKTSASTEKATQLTSVQAAAYNNLSNITNKVLSDREKMMAALDIEAIGLQEVSLARKKANVEDLIAIKRVQELAKLELELAGITDEEVKAKTRLIRTAQINNNLMEESNKIVEERKKAKLEEQLKREEERAQRWESIMSKSAAVLAVVAVGVAGVAAVVSKANEKWDEQSKKMGNSASALGSIAEANAAAQKAQDKMWGSLGKVIDRSSIFQASFKAAEGLFKVFQKLIDDNSQALANFANEIGQNAAGQLTALGGFIKDNAEQIARFVELINAGKEAIGFLVNTGGLLVDWLQLELYGALGLVSTGLIKLIDGLSSIIKLSGSEVPQSLEDMRLGLKEMQKTGIKGVVANLDDLEKGADKAINNLMEVGESLGKAFVGTRSDMAGTIGVIEEIGKTAEETGKKVTENLRTGVNGNGKGRKDLIDAETRAEEKRQKVLLDYDARILQAQRDKNDELAIELTRERALVEARQSLVGIKTKELKQATLTVAELQAQIDYENSLKDLAEKRKQDAAAAHDIEMQARQEKLDLDAEEEAKAKERYDLAIARINSRYELETELINNIGSYISESFGGIAGLIDNISESTQRMIDGFAAAAPQVTNLVNAFRAYNQAGNNSAKQQAAFNTGVSASVGIMAAATDAFIDNEQTKAIMLGLINAAAAAASLASGIAGNPAGIPASIQYGIASAGYFAAAAFSGGGGGGGGGASGPAPGSYADAASQRANADAERRANAEAIADAISERDDGGSRVINIDFKGAVFASESPDAARQIVDLISPELEKRLRRG